MSTCACPCKYVYIYIYIYTHAHSPINKYLKFFLFFFLNLKSDILVLFLKMTNHG